MRVHIATVWDGPHSHELSRTFTRLAALDHVREHRLEPEADEADAVLFVDVGERWDDPLQRALRRHELTRTARRRVFVYNTHDRPLFVFPGIYVSGQRNWGARFPGAVGGPYVELLGRSGVVESAPDLLYSFVGSRSHPLRDRVLGLRDAAAVLHDSTAVDFFATNTHSDAHAEARARYRAVLARSKFVLCPRGFGPSSMRLFEALRAGRVPVIISDEWLPPPRVDWGKCSIRVPECEVHQIPSILRACECRWHELVLHGQHALSTELGESRLWHHVCTSLATAATLRRRRWPWWAQRRVIQLWTKRDKSADAMRAEVDVGRALRRHALKGMTPLVASSRYPVSNGDDEPDGPEGPQEGPEAQGPPATR